VIALAKLGDLIVLAEDATQSAIRKEDGSGSGSARQNRLLAMVRENGINPKPMVGLAESGPTLKPIGTALSRAEVACL